MSGSDIEKDVNQEEREKLIKIRNELKKLTEDYYDHLLVEFQRELRNTITRNRFSLQGVDMPSIAKRVGDLYEIGSEDNKNEIVKIGQLSYQSFKKDISESLNSKDENNNLFNELCDKVVGEIWKKKLEVIHKLLSNFKISNYDDNKQIKSQIISYKELLEKEKKNIQQHRNGDWSKFHTAVSILLFPLTFLYSATRRIKDGLWDIKLSQGGMFVEKARKKTDEVKPDEVKPDEVKPDEVKPDEVKPDEVKPDEVKPDEENLNSQNGGGHSRTF